MSSKTRIEQCVDDIIVFISSCKEKKFSSGKEIIVNKDEIDDLLSELQRAIPDDIEKYHKLVKNQQEIIQDAQRKADLKIQEAESMKNQMVSQNELMQEISRQADSIVREAQSSAMSIIDTATNQANAIKMQAINHTDELLANLERVILDSAEKSNKQYELYVDSLRDFYSTIVSNRKELEPIAKEADVMSAIAEVNELTNQGQVQ